MLKKSLFIFLLALFFTINIGAVDLGIGANFNIHSESEKDDDSETAIMTDLIIEPVLIMKLSDTLEIDPFLYISYISSSDPDSIASFPDDYNQLSLGGGATLLFHFLKVRKLDFSIGGKAAIIFGFQPQGDSAPTYNSYGQMEIDILAPIVMDINFYKNFYFRIKHEIPVLTMNYLKTGTGAGTTTTTELNFLDYEDKGLGSFRIFLGVFYMF